MSWDFALHLQLRWFPKHPEILSERTLLDVHNFKTCWVTIRKFSITQGVLAPFPRYSPRISVDFPPQQAEVQPTGQSWDAVTVLICNNTRSLFSDWQESSLSELFLLLIYQFAPNCVIAQLFHSRSIKTMSWLFALPQGLDLSPTFFRHIKVLRFTSETKDNL